MKNVLVSVVVAVLLTACGDESQKRVIKSDNTYVNTNRVVVVEARPELLVGDCVVGTTTEVFSVVAKSQDGLTLAKLHRFWFDQRRYFVASFRVNELRRVGCK